MRIPIRRTDPALPLPSYKTPGAVALDCSVRVTTTVPPGAVAYLPLNIALKLPAGHFALMAPRSSLHRRGLFLANSVGIFDEDFSGDADEYQAAVYNLTAAPVTVERGERVTQLIVLPYDKVEWQEVLSHGTRARGGFGSTGR